MKILELRFQNLNSLYGEWHIDFTHPEYLADGIFAITGPTGAGKSTILDAICLALYGETPRLGKITAKNNEIISRRTAECYAEVTFTSSAGTFRCHWSQSRARKKIDGALQDTKHEISNALNGELLESKKNDVKIAIEDKTGMNFERFTRSIMLAQGSFAAFLQASADERSPILEQITGTKIYSDISKKVHERQKIEKEKLDFLSAEADGMTILDEAQENNLQQHYVEKIEQIGVFTQQHKTLQEALQQHSNLKTLAAELTQLKTSQQFILEGITQFIPSQQKLDLALKAAELEGEFATLTALRVQQQTEQILLLELDNQLPAIAHNLAEKETQLNLTKANNLAMKDKQKLAMPLIKKVRELDFQQIEQQKQLKSVQDELSKWVIQIEKNQQQHQFYAKKQDRLTEKNKQIQDYLINHAQDTLLVEKLAGITEQLGNFQQLIDDTLQKQADIQQQEKALIEQLTTIKKHNKQLKTINNTAQEHRLVMEQNEKSLSALLDGRLLREYRSDKEHLQKEKIFMVKIGKLEEERQKLTDGEPCPLCGSIEHPFALGNIPPMDELDKQLQDLSIRIKQAEQIEINIQQTQDKRQHVALQKSESEKTIEILTTKTTAIELNLVQLRDQYTAFSTRSDKLKNTILIQLNVFNISMLPDNNDTAELIAQLTSRRDTWLTYQNSSRLHHEQWQQTESALQQINILKQHLDEQFNEKQCQLERLKQQDTEHRQQRQSLYGEKSPDEEETKLEQMMTQAEQQLQHEQKRYDEIKEQHTQIKVRQQTLSTSVVLRCETLNHQEKNFIALLEQKDFINESSFLASRLSDQERYQLTEQAKSLSNKKTEISTRINDREKRYTETIEQIATMKNNAELKRESEKLSLQLNDFTEALGAIKQQLSDNDLVKTKMQNKLSLINKQKNEYHKWLKLHDLIGSADGKKYRNFAQGLTFEIMTSYANQQLEKMTDRYLLIPDQEQALELNVIDNYQAGEIRSTKNLSGGESFIVSLALALGLSKMSSQKVRVDSLFLDEGFGTLDEDALEMALSALAGLQQEGKLIGVISHVLTLKERINTQINVTPLNNGKSQLSGVGCYNL